MKNALLFVLLFVVTGSTCAQVGIGTASPNSTLDVRGSLAPIYRSFSGTTTTITSTDFNIVFNGTAAATATLPDATTCSGRIYYIKNFSTTSPVPVLTLATVSSQKIDGSSTWILDETNESVGIFSNGSNWVVHTQSVPVAKSGTTGGSWNEGGNPVTGTKAIGTTIAYDFPVITNNVERMRINSSGNVGIGSSSFATNPEALLVYQNSSSSFNVIAGKGNLNNYLQLNIQNLNNGATASSDLVATADNGNESSNYVDLGMNSSGYSSTGITGGADNAYLYSAGNDFVIGNSTAAKNLIFFTGGTGSGNERMRISGSGNVGVGNTSPSALLDVNGTVKVGTAGTVLNSIIRFTNQSITDNTSFDYTTSRTETLTLTGVLKNATVIVTPRSDLPTGMGIGYAYASAANTVKISLTQTGAAQTLGTVVFDITVIQ